MDSKSRQGPAYGSAVLVGGAILSVGGLGGLLVAMAREDPSSRGEAPLVMTEQPVDGTERARATEIIEATGEAPIEVHQPRT